MTGGHEPLIVIVSRSGSGLFDARPAGEAEALCKNSRTPLLAAARVLIGRGHDPAQSVVMRHAGSNTDCLISALGAAAALTVDESGTPRFRPWRAYPAAAVEGVGAECADGLAASRQPSTSKTRRASHLPRRKAKARGCRHERHERSSA